MTTGDELVQRLLAEAEDAVIRLDWATVQARCDAVAALDPSNERVAYFRAAASRALNAATPALASEPVPAGHDEPRDDLTPVESVTVASAASETADEPSTAGTIPAATETPEPAGFRLVALTILTLVFFFPVGLILM